MYKHYIRLDENNNVTAAFSSAFQTPLEGDVCVNENGGRHFHLKLFFLQNGQPLLRNKFENNKIVDKKSAEITVEEKSSVLSGVAEQLLREANLYKKRYEVEKISFDKKLSQQPPFIEERVYDQVIRYMELLQRLRSVNLANVSLEDISNTNSSLYPSKPDYPYFSREVKDDKILNKA